MWCENNNCDYYDTETDSCTRISNKDKETVGVCWMEKGEGEY